MLNLLGDRRKISIDLSFVAGSAQATVPPTPAILLALSPARLRLDDQAISLPRDGAVRIAGPGTLAVDDGLVAVATLEAAMPVA